ncbi:28S ribosomal protein S26, mitochondrial [Larimichthys crocea]|uniref:Uncharacterized protein n=1 Tax=Larimichthys crocea TaxID=215358 RepID=A0ACD3RPQ5_LARCR|nr:28S ribosomal protein S26, mitochondrial [Larimichthys crocea]
MFPVLGGRSVQAARLLAPRCAVLVEAVRGRKSRTDPVAKSKEGRIKVPPPVDPAEMVVLKDRYSEYQLLTRALRGRLSNVTDVCSVSSTEDVVLLDVTLSNSQTVTSPFSLKPNETDIMKSNIAAVLIVTTRCHCYKQRDMKGFKQDAVVDCALTCSCPLASLEFKEEEAAVKREREQQEFIREREQEILQLQEDAKNFITMENLDQRIEDALDNPKNYNFAIDREGRVVKQTTLQ